ncbi:MAG: divalent metal cation transporter [Allomuricauda sp.]|nr:MAG: divalent metal cation transporter [Allomuricauda sp.]
MNKNIRKAIGPGLLFATNAIGTSHLVFSTKAGAEFGFIYFWIILGALLLTYPFFEFSVRYVNGRGRNLLQAYKEQSRYALWLVIVMLLLNTLSVSALCKVADGLFTTILGYSGSLALPLLIVTALILVIGRFSVLDNFIKVLCAVLGVTLLVTFIATLVKGPVEPLANFTPKEMFDGYGLALLVATLGYMPAPMFSSIFQSVWNESKVESSNYKPTLKEVLFDFNFGFILTAILAFLFLIIGVFTLYGSGTEMSDATPVFAKQLIGIFTNHIGEWSFLIIGITAFAAIYGTFLAAIDGFSRTISRGLATFSQKSKTFNSDSYQKTSNKYYPYVIGAIVVIAIIVISQNVNMGTLLRFTAILAFFCSPIIAFLNMKAVTNENMPKSHRPKKFLLNWSYLGLAYIFGVAILVIAYRLGLF